MSLTFEPYIPLALWLPLAVSAAALLTVYAFASRRRIPAARRGSILALMGLAAAMPLAVLLNPTWIETLPPPAGKPLLTVLVDVSGSMAINDADGKTRLHQAVQLARATAGGLANRYDVHVRAFADRSVPLDVAELERHEADGPATNLAAAISQSLEDRPQGQALLVLSDGAHNAASMASLRESLEQSKSLATPIFTHTLGSATEVSDLEVRLNLPQELAFVRQETPVTAIVRQRGHLTDKARVSLVLDGQDVAENEVSLAADGTAEVVFPVSQEKRGLYRYEVRIAALPSEATVQNNSATLILRVVDEPVHVLLLEGKPYWDAKFLVRTLAADESVQLESVVRLTEGRFLRRTISHAQSADTQEWTIEHDASQLLADPQRLASYQVIVLGRDAEVYLTDEAVARIGKWLAEQNGALVCFRGPPTSQVSRRLGDLIPVRWSQAREHRFRVQLTESGQAMPWLAGGITKTLEDLPSLATAAQAERPKPLAVVLATSQTGQTQREPVISYQPVGGGRVVVVEGAGMWRWAFLPPQHQEHDQVYRVLWRSLVRWLVSQVELLPSQQLALRGDKVTFDPNEPATATLLVRDSTTGQPPVVELLGEPSAEPQSFTPVPDGDAPGQYRVVFGKLPEGAYVAQVAGVADAEAACRTVFDVRGASVERLDVAARPDVMRLVAETSGGLVLERDDPNELARRFDEHLGAALPKRTVRTTAWDRWWVLVGVLAMWAATWGLRRGSGLI